MSCVCSGCGTTTDTIVWVCPSCQHWIAHNEQLRRERDEARAKLAYVNECEQMTHKENARLRNEILRRGWWRESGAPCVLCGYDGPGYYQPATHACAKEGA